jgi:cobalamin synthase
MNTHAVNHTDRPITAVFLTVVAGFVPLAGVVLAPLAAIWFVRRNRENHGLCIILIAVALVFVLLWVAYFAWHFGGTSSISHGHPSKVP